MKILLIGANGQLGCDLQKSLNHHDLIPLIHQDIEVADFNSIKENILKYEPKIVINTSAFHKVNICENEIEQAFKVNTYGVKYLAQICNEHNCTLVHFSTDYVFDGKKNTPYTENDLPSPLSVYGISKLAGEYFVLNFCKKYYLIRTTGLYGVAGCSGKGGNFVQLMLKLAKKGKDIKVVNDQILTPTSTKELAEQIGKLIETGYYGLYHITNNGECSWYEFAKAIFEIKGLKPNLEPLTTEQFFVEADFMPAQRPQYSVLGNYNLKRINLDNMSHWKIALKNYLSLI